MFLTIASPGDDLSYLLFKHPARVQAFDLPVGRATVFYPRADQDATEAALLVDVDSAALARSKRFRVSGFELGHYVNDRAYAASSLLAVALGRVFRSALTGHDPEDRPGAALQPRELTIHLPSVRSRGGASLVRELFEPLGWSADAVEAVPACVDLRLKGVARLQDALSQLYVLLPVLDDSKHYWVGESEVGKLVRHGEDWLAAHPARDLITARYLAHQREYVADATALPLAEEGADELAEEAAQCGRAEALTDAGPPRPPLGAERTDYLVAKLAELGAKRVLDLGCGEGRLVRRLLDQPRFEVVGADVSTSALDKAAKLLERLSDRQRERVNLIQASATYRDHRFGGFDAIVASEVIEHMDPDRLPVLERNILAEARPGHFIVTTPNAEYNRVYGLDAGEPRHSDHRFEWTRAEFEGWARAAAERAGYAVGFDGIGPQEPGLGQPTQAAVFTRNAAGGQDG
ncbi:MAG: 3' terminal RNA ribose 2'-O-methyltransferase Hen1 [Bifidobacteriaceae bacterium]|nr:3' terminal RNA ribose 2'-O-methyltransferase Hen1 [Bifidobacteriaceae bacterium]